MSWVIRLGILASLLFFYPTARAQSVLWTGGANTYWLEADNWSPAGIPTAATIATLANGDTVLLNGAANTATVDLLSITDGSLVVDDATLELTTGVNLGALAELEIRGGVLTSSLGGTTTLTGLDGSQLIFAESGGGTFSHTLAGVIDLVIEGGNTVLTAADTFSGALHHRAGTLSLTPDHSFTDATLTGGTLGGGGAVTFNGATSIGRYYLNRAGLTTFAGTTTLSRTGTESYQWLYLYPGSDVENSGSFTFSDTDNNGNDVYLYLRGDSTGAVTFTNLAGASLNFTTGPDSADVIHVDGSAMANNHLLNHGTLTVSSTGAGSTVFDAGTTFTNHGILNLDSGSLILQGSSDDASTGAFNVAGGATLVLDANTHTFGNGASVNGAGTLEFSGGVAVFAAGSALGIDALDFEFGTLIAAADLSIPGDTTFHQLYLDGPGIVTLEGTGEITRSGTSAAQWIQLTPEAHLRNAGDLTFTDTGASGNDVHLYLRGNSTGDATFTNLADATLTFHTGGDAADRIFVDGSNTATNNFFNYGTLIVSADGPDSRTTFDSGVNFENHGDLLLTGGTLRWQGNATAASTGDVSLSSNAILELDSGQQHFGAGADISGTGTFALRGSTATFDAGSTLTTDQIALTTGTLVAAGDLTLTGDVDIYQAYLSGPGTLTLAGMTNLARAQGGAYEWIQLNAGAAIANAGLFSLTDFYGEASDTHIYLAGNATNSAATFTNLSGATLDFSTGEDALDRIWFNGSNANYNHLRNEGTINVTSTGDGRVTLNSGTSFTNDGAVAISGGSLSIQGGSHTPSTGSFTVSPGATLDFAGGTSELDSTASISGGGTTRFSGGTTHLLAGATLGTDHLELAGGILQLATGQSFQNANLASGRLQNDGTSTFSGTVNLTQFDFDGPGTARFAGTTTLSRSGTSPYRWLELNVGASLENAGLFTISDTDASTHDTHVYLRGNTTAGATFTNLAGATLDLTTGATLEDRIVFDGSNAAANFFLNAGTLNLNSAGLGYAELDGGTSFDNTGELYLNSGALLVHSPTVSGHTGAFHLASGATYQAMAGTQTFAAGAAVTGDGVFRIDGATVNFAPGSSLDPGVVQLSSGRLGGAADLTLTGTVSLRQFYFDGPGTITLAGNSSLARTGTGAYEWIQIGDAATLHNRGTFDLSDTGGSGNDIHVYLRGNANGDATFENLSDGILNLNTGGDSADIIHFDGSNALTNHVVNHGTINVTAGPAGLVTFDAALTFDNRGTVNLTSGLLDLASPTQNGSSGAFVIAGDGVLELSSSTQTFTTGASISGAGGLLINGNATAVFNDDIVITTANNRLYAATVSGPGAVTFTGHTDLDDFTFAGSGLKTLAGTSSVTRGSTYDSETIDVSAGTELVNAGTLTLSDLDDYYYSHVYLNLNGSATNGNAVFRNTGTVTTYTEGTADDRVYFDGDGNATSFFYNEGTFRATSGGSAGYTLVDAGTTFVNSGLVALEGGVLYIQGGDGGTPTTGDFTVAAGTRLDLEGDYTFASGVTISGDGRTEFSAGTATFQTGAALQTLGLKINGGTVDLADAHTLASGNLESGKLQGTGAVTFSGAVGFTDFTYAGTGTLTLAGTSDLQRYNTNSSEHLHVAAGSEVINSGTFTIGDHDSYYYNHAYLDLDGSASGNAVFRNTGTFVTYTEIDDDDRVYIDGDGAATSFFYNEGTFRATSGGSTGYTLVDAGTTFVNSGLVALEGGVLYIQGGDGGTPTTGDFTVAAGTRLDLEGDYTFASGVTISGDGRTEFSAGTATFQTGAALQTLGLKINGGTVDLADAHTLASGNLESGKLQGNGALTFSGAVSLTDFTYAGTGTLTLAGTTDLQRYNTNSSEHLRVAAGSEVVNAGTFTIGDHDAYYYSHAYLDLDGSASGNAVFRNTGTFTTYTEIDDDDRVYIDGDGAATSFFYNEGTFRATSGGSTGYTLVDAGTTFVNSGLVALEGGVLYIQGGDGGTPTTGDFTVAAGTRLDLEGDYTFASGVTISGDGRTEFSAGTATFQTGAALQTLGLKINGGTVDLADPHTLGSGNLESGTLTGTGDVTFSGAVTITDFRMAGTGTKTLGGTTDLQRYGTNSSEHLRVTAGSEVVNAGTFTIGDHDAYTYGHAYLDLDGSASGNAVFRNTGTFTTYTETNNDDRVTIDGDGAGNSLFYNEGTFSATSGGTGYTLVDSGTSFFNSGTLNVQSGDLYLDGPFTQTAGVTEVTGGRLIKRNSPLLINGGVLRGTGTIIGDVEFNGGELAPGLSPGTLTIDGDLILYSGSLFTIEITGAIAGIDYDVVNVTGNMDLSGGVIELAFSNHYAPAPGDTFSFFNVDGTFTDASAINVTGLLPGWTFDTDFDALTGGFTLTSTSFAAVPEPSTWALLLLGGALLLLHARRRQHRR